MSDRLSADLASLRLEREAAPGKRRGTAKVLALALVTSGVITAGYLYRSLRISDATTESEVELASITLASSSPQAVELSSTGYVVTERVARVEAKVAGRVSRVAVSEGVHVSAGDVLLELDAAEYRAQRRTAETRVVAARARAAAAHAAVAEWRIQLDRERVLVGTGASPRARAEDLAARVDALETAAVAADAETIVAAAEATAAETRIEGLVVRSPIAGTVLNRPPQPGELVGALTLTPTPVEIGDMTSLIVETDVPEVQVRRVKRGSLAEVTLDAFPERRFIGEVGEANSKVDRQKASLRVKIRLTEPSAGVLAGMAARVNFLAGAPGDASARRAVPVVPASAVVDLGSGKAVYSVDDWRARLVPVTLGAPMGEGFELISGPLVGTRVVARPAPSLTTGQRVKEKR